MVPVSLNIDNPTENIPPNLVEEPVDLDTTIHSTTTTTHVPMADMEVVRETNDLERFLDFMNLESIDTVGDGRCWFRALFDLDLDKYTTMEQQVRAFAQTFRDEYVAERIAGGKARVHEWLFANNNQLKTDEEYLEELNTKYLSVFEQEYLEGGASCHEAIAFYENIWIGVVSKQQRTFHLVAANDPAAFLPGRSVVYSFDETGPIVELLSQANKEIKFILYEGPAVGGAEGHYSGLQDTYVFTGDHRKEFPLWSEQRRLKDFTLKTIGYLQEIEHLLTPDQCAAIAQASVADAESPFDVYKVGDPWEPMSPLVVVSRGQNPRSGLAMYTMHDVQPATLLGDVDMFRVPRDDDIIKHPFFLEVE